MVKKPFKNIELSRLGMGCMRLPAPEDKSTGAQIDWEEAHKLIVEAYNNGINYFDTAYVYNSGESEKCLGAGVKSLDRSTFYIADKYHIGANPDYKAVFEEQLERLQTDYIDFYLIHCLLDNNIDTYLESGCIEYFLEMQKQCRIKYLGFSSHSGVETLEKFANHHQWDFAQLQMNYFDWSYSQTKREYEILTERNIPVMVMEPVRGGRLAALSDEADKILKDFRPDWSIASWAFRFLKGLPNVQVILSGMSNAEQVEDNLRTFETDEGLTKEEEEVLFKACDTFHSEVKVPCTACRYCTDDCPMQIDIPEFLKIYNSFKLNGSGGIKNRIDKVESDGKPADCIGCGACTGHCPQSIDIPKAMKELAEVK